METKEVLIGIGALALIVVLLLIAPILLSVLWPVIIPTVFPGLVEQGYITDNLTILQSFGLIIITTILFRSFSSKNSKE